MLLWHLSDSPLSPSYIHSHPNSTGMTPLFHHPLTGNKSLAACSFQGPSLGNVNADSRSTCRINDISQHLFSFQIHRSFVHTLLVPVPPRTCRVAECEVAVPSLNKAHPEILLMKICSCSWDLALPAKAGDRIYLVKHPNDKYQVGAMSKLWSVHEWVFHVGWRIIWFLVAAEYVISPLSIANLLKMLQELIKERVFSHSPRLQAKVDQP